LLKYEKLIGSGKFHCKQTGKQHIWNSVETDRRWLNFGIGMFIDIIMRYLLELACFVQ
ncbi:hypothetical protein T05_12192, partial [Trichinella murrelli]